jgi:hypothetical protein
MTTTDTKYNVFHRTWWKDAETPGWPNNLEPEVGRKTYLACGVPFGQAHAICQEWNAAHAPGRYSRKAEYEEV